MPQLRGLPFWQGLRKKVEDGKYQSSPTDFSFYGAGFESDQAKMEYIDRMIERIKTEGLDEHNKNIDDR